jgi:hypothetical protein
MYLWLLFQFTTHAQTVPFAVKYQPLSSMRWSIVYDYDSMYLGLTNDGILARFDPDFNLLNKIQFKIPVHDTAVVSSLDLLTAVLPTDSGYYILGTHHTYYDNEKAIEKRGVFIGFLSSSFEQKWVHFISNHTVYDDTVMYNPIISLYEIVRLPSFNEILIGAGSENAYSFNYNTDSVLKYKDRLFFYNILDQGKIRARRSIPFVTPNIWQFLKFRYASNCIVIDGMSYFPQNNSQLFWKRPVFAIVDTGFQTCKAYPFQDSVHEFGSAGYIRYKDSTFSVYTDVDRFEEPGSRSYTTTRIWKFNNQALPIYQRDILKNFSKDDTLSLVYQLASIENNIVSYQQLLPKRNWNLRPIWERVGHELVLYDSVFNYLKKKELNAILPIVFSGPNVPHWGNGIFVDRFNKIVLFGGGGYEKNSFICRLNNNLEQDTLYNFKDLDYTTRFVGVPKDTTITLRITDSTLYIHRVYENWNDPVGFQKRTIAPTQITLSPNPATTQVHITSPVKLESYTISNTSGTQVQSGALENNNIDISQLPQGLYFLQVQLENGQMVTKKLVRSY